MKLLLFLFTFIISCTSIKPLTKQKIIETDEQLPIINRPVHVQLSPGKVTFVEFDINLPEGKWELTCKDQQIPFVVVNSKAKLFLAESYFSNLESYDCYYQDDSDMNNVETHTILKIFVKSFPYKREHLNVPKRRVDIKGEDLKRVLREKEIKKKIYLKSASYYLFDKPFKVPLDSFVTSYYGNKRIFNNKKQSQHLGNDFRAQIGIPIPSSNKGKVIYTGDLFFIGKVVVLDHGLNIFSVYGHLSKIKVHQGDLVEQGDIVGLSGMTGRVSGPHLHWGVRIQDHWVDGFSLVEQSKLNELYW